MVHADFLYSNTLRFGTHPYSFICVLEARYFPHSLRAQVLEWNLGLCVKHSAASERREDSCLLRKSCCREQILREATAKPPARTRPPSIVFLLRVTNGRCNVAPRRCARFSQKKALLNCSTAQQAAEWIVRAHPTWFTCSSYSSFLNTTSSSTYTLL